MVVIRNTKNLTLSATSIMIVETPNTTSHSSVSCIFSTVLTQESRKAFVLPPRPRSPLSCDDAIVIAAADVNPDVTGIDIKSTKNPVKNFWSLQ